MSEKLLLSFIERIAALTVAALEGLPGPERDRRIEAFEVSLAEELHRYRSCETKQRYRRELTARTAAAVMADKMGEPFAHYKCRFCSGFHVGHPPGWRAGKRRRRRAASA